MRKIGTIHLSQNQAIQITDPVYLGWDENLIIPLQWPDGDYPVYYHEDGILLLCREEGHEHEWLSGTWLGWGEEFGVDSGFMAIAPSSFAFENDKAYQDYQDRRTVLAFGDTRRVIAPAFIIDNTGVSSTAYGDGTFPVFVDNLETPTMIQVNTNIELVEDDTFSEN